MRVLPNIDASPLNASASPLNSALRLAVYWTTSVVGAGLVAGLARLPTYSGNVGTFSERFILYAIPFPVALGMLHLPALVVGSVLCLVLATRARRILVIWLGITLAVAVAMHLLAHVASLNDHWIFFMYGTIDIAILWALGLFSRRPGSPRSEKSG